MSITTQFPRDELLSGIAIAITNNQLVADRVLPRGTPFNKKKFSYLHYNSEQFFNVPETAVSRKGRLNQSTTRRRISNLSPPKRRPTWSCSTVKSAWLT
jgi:hypothetical protein